MQKISIKTDYYNMETIIYFQLYLLYYLFTNSSLPCFVILDWTL